MSLFNNISISFKIQQFSCNSLEFLSNETTVLKFESTQNTNEVVCPVCGGKVHVYDNGILKLKDAPLFINTRQVINVHLHRYRCLKCGHTFTEKPDFVYPGTHITTRNASWIKSLLRVGLCISSVSKILGVSWDTICRIHKDFMTEEINARKEQLKLLSYRPKLLAVDEFAIHKGHTYATCVMDLVSGEVIWVGKGRAKDDFEKFFKETDPEFLKDVKAVAMDMNSSYNLLVSKYMPHAEIVYDRYHMQAQYGKDVLGAVRLEEAQNHHIKAKGLYEKAKDTDDKAERRKLKSLASSEMSQYTDMKQSRWRLLRSSESLSNYASDHLQKILDEHEKLSVCYVMKEEMCRLFSLNDISESETGWKNWFHAAIESNIAQLVHFAELKEKRLPGLIAHAKYPISTGRLEGLNNKIKVAKRIGYGYRNDDYFFTLIRYLSIPDEFLTPNFP